MYKKLIIIMTILSMAGCASNASITQEVASAIRNQEIAKSDRVKPPFFARTAAKNLLLGPVLKEALVYSDGKDIVTKYNIDDPAVYIADKLIADLGVKYGLKVSAKPINIPIDEDNERIFPQRDADVDLLLDIRTRAWGFMHLGGFDFDKHMVVYDVQLRLIDIKRGALLVKGDCDNTPVLSFPAPKSTPPTYDELLLNNAERLKTELKVLSDSCLVKFKSEVLQL